MSSSGRPQNSPSTPSLSTSGTHVFDLFNDLFTEEGANPSSIRAKDLATEGSDPATELPNKPVAPYNASQRLQDHAAEGGDSTSSKEPGPSPLDRMLTLPVRSPETTAPSTGELPASVSSLNAPLPLEKLTGSPSSPAPITWSRLQPFAKPFDADSAEANPGTADVESIPGSITAVPPVPAPMAPKTLVEAGVSLASLSDLVLKHLYLRGVMQGGDLSQDIRLPFPLVDEALKYLKDQRLIEVTAGDVVGRIAYRFSLTELGRVRAREVFDQCRYVGPAPVPIEQYIAQCKLQSVVGAKCSNAALRSVFRDCVISRRLIDELGPAICSGRSIFVYGPPGNGKTMIAKGLGRYLNNFGGEIYVPYAIQAENSVITLFDPTVHETTDDLDMARRGIVPSHAVNQASSVVVHGLPIDLRWRRVRRPVVITGGELTLEMLELQYNTAGNFYSAPLHIKANGGVFLIDDFGRQLVSPKALLNRWIVPLEERVDYLALVTGRKFQIPFEQLVIFSTNLDPGDLVDDAFLRRIKHKIRIDPPDRRQYARIMQMVCDKQQLQLRPEITDCLFDRFYDLGRIPRSSDPRDIVEIAQSICRFNQIPIDLTEDLICESARRFFASI